MQSKNHNYKLSKIQNKTKMNLDYNQKETESERNKY